MQDDTDAIASAPPPPSVVSIFLTFTKISLSSFGGGLSGWMMREFVENKRWLTDSEFLAGLALAQAFPGVNVVNLSIWVGYRLRRGPGALAGALGMVAPAMVVAIALLTVFDELSRYPVTQTIMTGVAAAAIGLSLQMGARAAWRCLKSPLPLLVMAATFISIFVLRLPLLPVVAVVAPISIFLAFRGIAKEAPGHG